LLWLFWRWGSFKLSAQAGLKLRSSCKKNNLFYQSICHPLSLLKIPQVAILGDLHCLKGSCFFWILVQPHCPRKLPAKLRALTCPSSLLAIQERLWTFDLDKSQVRSRCNCVRDIRRSHYQSFCAHMSHSVEWICACTLLIKRNCLVKIFSVSHVPVFNTGRSLILTLLISASQVGL
jgi:hypothetical protein